jgi:hypothetical protein
MAAAVMLRLSRLRRRRHDTGGESRDGKKLQEFGHGRTS